MDNISKYRIAANKLLGEYQFAKKQVATEKQALLEARKRLETLEATQNIFQQIAQTVQQSAHERIAAVVTKCLKIVFGKRAYGFKIEFERKRGKTEAKLIFLKGDKEIRRPTKAASGGQIDVAAFALRTATIVMTQPKIRRLEILDEPFLAVRGKARWRVEKLLLSLAQELDIQFVIVPQNDALKVGKVVELGELT